jgi:uncharacterized membrane protein (DUF485 family)
MAEGGTDQAAEQSRRLAQVAEDPRYQALLRRRTRLTWTLTAIMLVVFFGYILLIAFDRAFLARPIGGGATTLGIPIGIGVIAVGILLTGVYVWRARRDFDPVLKALREDSKG